MACRLGNFESRHLSPSNRVSDVDYHDVQNRRPSLALKLLPAECLKLPGTRDSDLHLHWQV